MSLVLAKWRKGEGPNHPVNPQRLVLSSLRLKNCCLWKWRLHRIREDRNVHFTDIWTWGDSWLIECVFLNSWVNFVDYSYSKVLWLLYIFKNPNLYLGIVFRRFANLLPVFLRFDLNLLLRCLSSNENRLDFLLHELQRRTFKYK